MAQTTNKVVVEVKSRTETGKNACRRLRARGLLPGNVYGLGLAPFKVEVNPRRVEEVLKLGSGQNTVFTLSTGDGQASREAMIRELQRDPLTEAMLHIDFVRVDPHRKVHVRVPVRLVGTPEGVKNEGGVLDFVHREVEVECLPGSIPERLDVDVSGLHVNQHVSVSDLAAGGQVQVLDDPESIIAVVSPPRVEEAPVAEEVAEAPEAEEPEVIKKGKEAEEEAGGEQKES